MEPALDIWRRRAAEPWIHGVTPDRLGTLIDEAQARLAKLREPRHLGVTATEPLQVIAEFLAAVTHANPVQLFLGDVPPGAPTLPADRARVMIATSGTSGAPRYAVHTWETLAAAAAGLRSALGGGAIHSVCLLPLSHVSGLMQVVRSFVSGGTLVLADRRAVTDCRFPAVPEGAVTSLVPTQLARLLDVSGGVDWLRQFRAVFIGGAPMWPALLARARSEHVPLAPCYGMTETAAQVTMRSPDEFLAGSNGVGRALPHAQVEIVDEETGVVQSPGVAGRIRVRGASLFDGYYPEVGAGAREFLTSDHGVLAADGSLTVLGRADAAIITGGEKVDPTEVEVAIRATGLVSDVAVVGVPDAQWGEAVVAVIAGAAPGMEQQIAASVRSRLAAAQRPKRWVHVPAVPRNDAGKIDRPKLRALAEN